MTFSLYLLPLCGLLMLTAVWSDLKRRIIPNGVSLGLALLGVAMRLADGSWAAAAGVALAVFVVMTVFWRFGLVGGGDVKLLAGSVLLVPPAQVMALLLAVSFCGGLLALVYLGLAAASRRRGGRVPGPTGGRLGPLRRLARIEAWRARRHAGLPYGCAIALGTLIAAAGR